MIIPIRLPGQVDAAHPKLPPILATIGFNETAIIELQGSIEVDGEKSGQHLGTLDVSIPNKPTLQIGFHLLEGKIVSLSKPLAVLLRVPNPDNASDSPIAFDMVAIVRKKLVFSRRPSPIVGEAAVTAAQESLGPPVKRQKP